MILTYSYKNEHLPLKKLRRCLEKRRFPGDGVFQRSRGCILPHWTSVSLSACQLDLPFMDDTHAEYKDPPLTVSASGLDGVIRMHAHFDCCVVHLILFCLKRIGSV